VAHRFHRSILREYDVRGVVGQTLGPADAHAIGRSFATLVRRSGGQAVVVGRDGRVSSPEVSGRNDHSAHALLIWALNSR